MDHLIKPEWSTLKRLMFMKAASGGNLSEYEVIGNPAVFNTNVSAPLSGFTIPFLPVQTGDGDPSPDNVRPIIGWSGVGWQRAGEGNVWDEQCELGGYDTTTGNKTSSSNSLRCVSPVSVLPNTRYRVRRGGASGGIWMLFLDDSGNVITDYANPDNLGKSKNAYSVENKSVLMPSNCHSVIFYITSSYGAEYRNDISINFPDTDMQYHPYSGCETDYVTFPDGQTVYGGTLDAVNGVLTVTHKCVSLNDPDKWTQPTYNFIYDVYFNDRKQGYREDDVCSCFRTNSRGYPYLIWAGQSLNRYACYPGSTGLTIDDMKALAEANAIFCVYELAEPIEIQLDPLTISTLIGDNTIWTDTNGENTIRYKKKG